MKRVLALFALFALTTSAGTVTLRWTFAFDAAVPPQKPADHFLYGFTPCLPTLALPGMLQNDNSPQPAADVGVTVVQIQKNLGIKSLSLMKGSQ